MRICFSYRAATFTDGQLNTMARDVPFTGITGVSEVNTIVDVEALFSDYIKEVPVVAVVFVTTDGRKVRGYDKWHESIRHRSEVRVPVYQAA